MSGPDLVLLHPPSFYDFRKKIALYGPISDVIPSKPVFDMYPLGFVSIVGFLERHGYRARIVNLAARMLSDEKFDVDQAIMKLRTKAFGIDLHWLVHAHGSLEIAKIVKKHHPDIPIILGGMSASYYHNEIMTHYPEVNYVLRGDSTEKPLLELLQCIEQGQSTCDIPNLTSRDEHGKLRTNPITHVPDNLDDFILDYSDMIDIVISHKDLAGSLPYESWLEYPFTALITCKGCTHNCITCGGSHSAYRGICNREKVAVKSPEKIAEEMSVIQQYIEGPIFLLGDLREGGNAHATRVLEEIRRQKIDNPVVLELFTPSVEFVKTIADNLPRFSLEISPETHDEEIRTLQGRYYSNNELEATIETAFRRGCEKFDVFFMIGLPGQTSEKALDTVEYARHLLIKHDDGRLHPFIAPLAPFLDPGSLAFESPETYGYKVLCRTLNEHREALANPSWKYFLNYETIWMNRDQITAVTYEAMYRMNHLKLEFGLLERSKAETIAHGIELSRAIARKIDSAMSSEREPETLREVREMILSMERKMASAKEELRVPSRARIKKGAVAKQVLRHYLDAHMQRPS